MTESLVRKLVTELIGTFVLVFTVITAVMQKSGAAALAPLAIGAALMVAIYAGGHISGAHYNPAVSLAAFIRGRLGAVELPGYWVAQIAGSALAVWLGKYTANPPKVQALDLHGRALGSAFTAELIFTFILAFVVLNVATSKDHPNNSFYGLAIGFVVVAGAVAVGPVSGGAFNPAVGFGICLASIASWSMFWVYVVACLAGGAIAGGAFLFLNPDDK